MTQLFINKNGKVYGPYSKEQVKNGLQIGKLNSNDLVGKSQAGPWSYLSQLFSAPAKAEVNFDDDLFAGSSTMQRTPQWQVPQAPPAYLAPSYAPNRSEVGRGGRRGTTAAEILEAVDEMNLSDSRREHFIKVFTEIREGGDHYKASWNWYAFLFGFFWYLSSGLYVKALLMFVISVLMVGLPAPVFWFYCGLSGNYDLYLKRVKNRDLW